jgi:hypothetical protein
MMGHIISIISELSGPKMDNQKYAAGITELHILGLRKGICPGLGET